MASGSELRTRAIRVRAAIRQDAAARARFAAIYTGSGDAVAELETFLEPTQADAIERARLREVAFGRAAAAQEETLAATARNDLDALDAAAAARETAIAHAIASFDSAPVPAPAQAAEVGLAAAPVEPTTSPRPAGRRQPPLWMIITASFILGLAVASAVALAPSLLEPATSTGSAATPTAPSTTPTRGLRDDDAGVIEQASVATRGDVDKADAVLSRPAARGDRSAGFLPIDVDPDSTRRLLKAGSTIVYAARNISHEYCLIVIRDEITTSRCADAAGFADSGLFTGGASETGSSDPTFAVRWNGEFLQVISRQ